MNFEEFAADLERVFEMLKPEDRQILVQKGERLYRVELANATEARDLWTNYDANRARQALRQSAGALAGVDIKELMGDLHATRGQRSRGRPA
jgi:hypothetical protein